MTEEKPLQSPTSTEEANPSPDQSTAKPGDDGRHGSDPVDPPGGGGTIKPGEDED